MSNVYIIQDNPYSPKNFLPAAEYGELKVVFENHVPTPHIEKSFVDMKRKLENLTKADYIVPTGHPALIAAAGLISMDILGEINLLIWDHQSSGYYPVKIGG